MESKFFLKSKSVIGLAVIVVSMFFGFTIEDQTEISGALEAIVDNTGLDDAQEIKGAVTAVIANADDTAKQNFVDTLIQRLDAIFGAIGVILVAWGRLSARTNLTLSPTETK
jgi:hypothetical protein